MGSFGYLAMAHFRPILIDHCICIGSDVHLELRPLLDRQSLCKTKNIPQRIRLEIRI